MPAALSHADSNAKQGFTLIELLVVVSIISLLVSILLPALSKARQHAKAVVCLTRMKSMALGLTMYTHEYGDSLPPAVQPPDEGDGAYKSWWWKHLIGKYLEYEKTGNPVVDAAGNEFWICPVFKPSEDMARYAINDRLMTFYMGWPCRPMRAMRIGSPAQKIFAGDAYNDHLLYDYSGLQQSYLYPRHSGGTFNIAFLDGHGAALRADSADILRKIDRGEYPKTAANGSYLSMPTLTAPHHWLPRSH